MSLKEKIDADIKKAMLAKNKDELTALRSIKSMIILAETEKGSGGTLNEQQEMAILSKAAKQRKESADLYKENGRKDLFKKEEEELEIITRYLPEQMSEDEIEKIIKDIITQTGAENMKDMGKVMGMATKQLAGKADGKAISLKVKSLLS